MLPTFSLNTEPQKKFTEIVYSLIKGKENISSEELSNIAEYAYKKAYDNINCTYKTFKYNLKWEGNQGVYKSDKQRKYMPDMISLEENQEMVENKYYYQDGLYNIDLEYDLEQVDELWAIEFILKNYMYIMCNQGYYLFRLLELCLNGDKIAIKKLKVLLKNIENDKGKNFCKDLKYAISLIILMPDINFWLKNGLSDKIFIKYNKNYI